MLGKDVKLCYGHKGNGSQEIAEPIGLGGWSMGLFDFLKSSEAKQAERQVAEVERQLALSQVEENRRVRRDILDCVEDGVLPDVTFVGASLPFRFQKSETVLYVFQHCEYLEQVTRRRTVGRSNGVGFRVAKGLTLRTGRFEGTPVEYDEVVHRGSGMLAVTSKNLYFSGQRSVRIPFAKVVATEEIIVKQEFPAIGVTRDRASGHPEFFVFQDIEERDFALALMDAIPSVESWSTNRPDNEIAEAQLFTPESDYAHDEP